MNGNRFYGMMDALYALGVVERKCSGVSCTYVSHEGKKIETTDEGYDIYVNGTKIPMEDIEDVCYESDDVVVKYRRTIIDSI